MSGHLIYRTLVQCQLCGSRWWRKRDEHCPVCFPPPADDKEES